jgi:hypothetical protein
MLERASRRFRTGWLHRGEHGRLGWGAPENEKVHSFTTAFASSLGTYLHGRRKYETTV